MISVFSNNSSYTDIYVYIDAFIINTKNTCAHIHSYTHLRKEIDKYKKNIITHIKLID
jgi:hypothetical protein